MTKKTKSPAPAVTSKSVASKSSSILHNAPVLKAWCIRMQRELSEMIQFIDDAESAAGSALSQKE